MVLHHMVFPLTRYLLAATLLSADNLCNQFGHGSVSAKGSKTFNHLIACVLERFLKKINLKKKVSRRQKKYEKLSSMQKVIRII